MASQGPSEFLAPRPTPSPVPILNMPSPLRPPIPGGARSGARTPRLGLSIPAKTSPAPSRPTLPALHIATPMGTQVAPQETLPRLMTGGLAGGGGSSAHSRSGSFGLSSNSTSAGSQYSHQSQSQSQPQPQPKLGLSINTRGVRTPDPSSAAGSMYSGRSDGAPGLEREHSLPGLDGFDKLAIERAREQDVEDLDEEGWRIVSREKRVVEISTLGEGAGGAVTKCKLKGGKTLFALKIITSNPDPDVRKQIIRELKFNKKCRDPHICRYWGAFEDPATSTLSIAMEFCEGGSLDSVYKEVKKLGGRTGEKVLGKIAEGVLRGLTYLHGEHIIHRDIKPSNILLCRNGDIKLCDFGVSGIFGTKGEADTFIGTSYYMAPERITGQPYTITSDVWSTGVTLLEVAQHRFPFPADGTESHPTVPMIDLLTYIVRQKTPELKDEPDNGITWSPNFKYFIACCLEKDPNRRGKPWRMLEHPWMVDMATKRVNMSRYLAQVWGWNDKSKSSSSSK